jgi:hypothetical protein
MSKLARVLVIGAMLAAANLAGMTIVAQAHATNEPAGQQDALRPPSERQVGESWRHRQVTADRPALAGDAQRPPTERQVGEPWRHQTGVPPAEPSGQPGWLIAALGLLTAALALAGGLAVMAARRVGRRARVGHAA